MKKREINRNRKKRNREREREREKMAAVAVRRRGRCNDIISAATLRRVSTADDGD